MPPVRSAFPSTQAWITTASPSVATARFTPRVRSDGRPTRTPTGTAPSTPQRTATTNDAPSFATIDAAIHPPMPASANWASESWPVNPVTTTRESTMIPNAALVVTASTAVVENTVATSTTPTARTGTRMAGRMRPDPTAGGRSVTSPRRGSDRPRTTSTRMITRNGTDSAQPSRVTTSPRCWVR